MENNLNFDAEMDKIIFDAVVKIEDRVSKYGNTYQVMTIGIKNKKTGEVLDIHEVYIKENLRQVIKFILDMNE